MIWYGLAVPVMQNSEAGQPRPKRMQSLYVKAAVARWQKGKSNSSILITGFLKVKVGNIILTMRRFYARSAMQKCTRARRVWLM